MTTEVARLRRSPSNAGAGGPAADTSFHAALQAGVTRHLRDPMQVVVGWVSLLKQRHGDPRRVEQALTIIERNAKRQMELLDDLLELARPSWALGLFRAHVDLTELTVQEALAAGLFHDLRAPLQVVLGWTSLLKRQHDDAGRLEHALTIIERNARVQLDLLDDLQELLQPLWARSPLRRAPVDLVDLVSTVVRGLEPVADERGLRLLFAIDSPAVVVQGHVVHLRRIVTNLVTNALKFTPRGGRIECRLLFVPPRARLVIRDSGRGIRQELLPRIFEPFIQEPDEGPHQPGVGLGLSVVRYLVELHGGEITAESSGLGQGATFTVYLPAHANGEQRERAAGDAGAHREKDLQGETMRIPGGGGDSGDEQ